MTTTTDKPASVAATLRAARALIEDPKRWIKDDYAKISKRSWVSVEPGSDRAGAWCALGALRAVNGRFLAKFDAAIKLAEKAAVPA